MTDLELLTAWQAGDAQAGETLFLRHFRALYRFFETKYPTEADELVQATFLACVGAKQRFHAGSSFRAYLFTVARHELYRVIRERHRAFDNINFEVSSIAELVATPGTRMDDRRERARLLAALQSLPVDVQMLLELHYWQGVSIGELAEIFGAPEVTIRSRLHRARGSLRELMAREPEIAGKIGETLEDFDAWTRGLDHQVQSKATCRGQPEPDRRGRRERDRRRTDEREAIDEDQARLSAHARCDIAGGAPALRGVARQDE